MERVGIFPVSYMLLFSALNVLLGLVAAASLFERTDPAANLNSSLFVERYSPVYVDDNLNQVYYSEPLDAVPIFTHDFNVKDAKGNLVAQVSEYYFWPTTAFRVFYPKSDTETAYAYITFPFIRYLATVTIDHRKYYIKGDFFVKGNILFQIQMELFTAYRELIAKLEWLVLQWDALSSSPTTTRSPARYLLHFRQYPTTCKKNLIWMR